jgi:hypothetical protein
MSMAAATTTDLVAVVATDVDGNKASTAYFSVNGGISFYPGSGSFPKTYGGPVASPVPGVAFLASTSRGILGTFDGGSSWQVVYTDPGASAYGPWSYLGFTTLSQGIALSLSGRVVMTHDGGHTWTPVTLTTVGS